MGYKFLWAGLLGLLSAMLTFGMPGDSGKDPGTSSVEEDKGGGTDPHGLTKAGDIDPNG